MASADGVAVVGAFDPEAQLLDLGHHFQVKLPQEGVPTPVRLNVRRELLGAVDMETLRLARYDRQARKYALVPGVQADALFSDRALLTASGEYSLAALPVDPVARAGIAGLCRLQGRPQPSEVEPICKVILCAGFKEIGLRHPRQDAEVYLQYGDDSSTRTPLPRFKASRVKKVTR